LENIEYMPKFVELMTTENVIEIRIVSMHIMKCFEFLKKKYFIEHARHAFLYLVDVLICNCIYIECSRCVDFCNCIYIECSWCL